MSPFRSLLFWLFLAVLGALGATLLLADPGLLLIEIRGWTVETSVAFAVLALLVAILLGGLVLRLLMLPVDAWRGHRRRRSRVRLASGLGALHEGRWQRAEATLLQAAEDAGLRAVALLNAARAAWARGDRDRCDAHLGELARIDAHAAALAQADAALAEGRPADAAAGLEPLAVRGALPPRGQLLRIRALLAAGRAGEAWNLLGGLRQAQVLDEEGRAALERQVAAQALREAPDADALAAAWDRIPKALRNEPEVVGAYAERAGGLGMQVAAAVALGNALDARWDEALAASYGRLPAAPHDDLRLGAAATWLHRHPNSPALLVTVARLEREHGRSGPALDHLHRALAQGADGEAWEELGHLYSERGDGETARLCYLNALRSARGEATLALPGRGLRERIGDEAVAEDRDEHGLPRLRG
ncbi:heme biosynthesis protein HemY [Coralloluteibacterium stylophorae]|uniref:Heme biosynthesis protein HemY n=1 Tax=Coralloluteibacterium stylophorae TaxID=1776034 RepID=A0A8J8AWF5_9GAMM|nr:heme biosynthesis HemY N-terminal domain-containing protein [Coralloluteibacterium stylophorae]MBS7457439.1 heme biosynthesis protein HemY [Coralloluteibacterium stylophorae]